MGKKYTWADNAKHCSARIIPSDWIRDDLQRNALRIETISIKDCADRCSMRPPDHWSKGAKERAPLWLFSGGDPLVFGICEFANCPMREFFRRTGGKKYLDQIS